MALGNLFSAPIMGTMSYNIEENSDTVIGVPLARMPVFSGIVDSVDLNSLALVIGGNSSLTENIFAFNNDNENFFYLKFTSGELEGAWFDISSNSSYSVSIKIGSSDLSLVEAGDSFEIIPHWTLGSLFSDLSGFAKSSLPISGVNCTFVAKYTYYDEFGDMQIPLGTNNAYQKFYFYRDYFSDTGWREIRSSTEDVSNSIIEPNSFIVLRQAEGVASSRIDVVGVVSSTSTSIEAFSLSSYIQDNYITSPSCSDITLSDLTESFVESGFLKSSTGIVMAIDAILVYDNTSTEINRAASGVYFYYNGFLAEKAWYSVGSGSATSRQANSDIIKAGSAIVIMKAQSSLDESFRVNYTPNYLNN